MKKSTIWILSTIMAFAFFGLLYMQIEYIKTSIQIRKESFEEGVGRAIGQVAQNLEYEQRKQYLMEDMEKKFSYWNSPSYNPFNEHQITTYSSLRVKKPDQYDFQFEIEERSTTTTKPSSSIFSSPNKQSNNPIAQLNTSKQEEMIKRYREERQSIDDLITELLEMPSRRPIEERINMQKLEGDLKYEMGRNGIYLPFLFEITDKNNKPILRQSQYKDPEKGKGIKVFTHQLFRSDPPDKETHLKIHFPNQEVFFYREMKFLIPSVLFTLILLVTFSMFLYTTFRQKKLSEMKSDFMNNMTHELKTPVSTISLAAQMLKDGAIMKSPEVFKHISGVIGDETERLSFQVEKVLQMSLFEGQKATLKFKELEINDIVAHVAHTFQIKVEKFGGNIDIDLQATESTVSADKMHLTNVLFNLLDNAVKYRREDAQLELMIRTKNSNNSKSLILSVEDNGMGMKKEDSKKIFDRFYRISTGNRHDVKGFGLGLAYVKKIVEDHKGTIKAESELGKGTKFIITIPVLKLS